MSDIEEICAQYKALEAQIAEAQKALSVLRPRYKQFTEATKSREQAISHNKHVAEKTICRCDQCTFEPSYPPTPPTYIHDPDEWFKSTWNRYADYLYPGLCPRM